MNKMANYIMIRDESRRDNGCPGYIKYVNPDGRLAVQIYINWIIDSKKVIRGNGLGQPFRSKKTFEEILDEAAEKAAKEYEELPPDPLEHPELHSR